MPIIKRLNVNTFTSEEDNDAFITELSRMWRDWSDSSISSKISVNISKDCDNPMRMTAFVTIDGEDALAAVNAWSKQVVIPVRKKYKHENLMIDGHLVSSITK
ncbi:hypothetical protein [Pseudopelagicola sp. nBUS_19]|uniref:hypothetical protein n=1 Tax=unclassified Pseudopelagicola TaxID=2649563 RepID=UPI003EC0C06C